MLVLYYGEYRLDIIMRLLSSRKVDGFSGITHILIAICLFFLMWLLPIDFSKNYINSISTSPIFTVIIFFVVVGGALLPDLDSSPLEGGGSTAIYQLGILGQILSMIEIIISSVVFSVLHTKHDSKPKSQHRLLWHTFFIPILYMIVTNFCIPSYDITVLSYILSMDINVSTIPDLMCMIFAIFTIAICVYLGSAIISYRIFKIISKQSMTQIFCIVMMVISSGFIANLPLSEFKLITDAVALGYIFHILGDLITEGSSPIFFPIPLRVKGHWQLWHKPYPIGHTLAVKTGGTVNIILNFVFLALDILLLYILVSR